jgi:hypothetical protein
MDLKEEEKRGEPSENQNPCFVLFLGFFPLQIDVHQPNNTSD